ncbi:MAG: hypothetical protein K6B65_05475 [Bacilli bacterium]|nr:hypothetical protein [Bacilli bacterium]
MKVMLFAILDHTEATEDLLRRLSKEGFNGTIISSTGMHHVLPKLGGESVSVSLSMIADDLPSGNLTLYIVIDEEKLEDLKCEIREATGNWTKVKGGMFVLPLLSVEGTF